MKGKKPAGKSECVKVAIRVRPMNKHEKEQNSTLCVDVDTANNTVSVSKTDTKTFQFDYVYPMETTQRQIYDLSHRRLYFSRIQRHNLRLRSNRMWENIYHDGRSR